MLRLKRLLVAALLVSIAALAEIRPLTILHTNDLHAHLSPSDDHHGGFAYLASVVRQEREACDHCVFLNAGDLVQGSPVSTIFHGLPLFEIGNLLGFDAATLGNHEFDYGWMQARKFIQTARHPIVSANVLDPASRLFAPAPYVILNVNKLHVAVIGAMTDTLRDVTTPKSLGDCKTLPMIETARRYAAELRDRSDLIVLLAHITPAEEDALLASAPEIPVTVAGHFHYGMLEPKKQAGRILVRVKSYGEELGRLDLQVDTEKKAPVSWHWKRIPIESDKLQPAADVAAQVKRWEDEVTARVDQPLAMATRRYERREVKLLIEQALREETGADFAFMNMGGVRDVLPKGQLLVRNIWSIMPFDNVVVTGTFHGRDLPAVVVGDRKIDPGRDYTLAVSDFTAAKQGTNENLRSKGLEFPHEVGLMRDLLIDWFRKKKVIGD